MNRPENLLQQIADAVKANKLATALALIEATSEADRTPEVLLYRVKGSVIHIDTLMEDGLVIECQER